MQPTILDRAIAWASPERAVSRMRARATLAIGETFFGGTPWAGARHDTAEMAAFNPLITRPMDDERFWDRRTLIARSANLDKGDVLAGGIVSELVTSVVGTGLALHPEPIRKLLGWDQDQAADWAQGVKERFDLWASNPNETDIERRRNFYQLQPLALRTVAVRGDAFCLMPRRRNPGGIWTLKLQLLEGDRIITPRNLSESDSLYQGVETDAYGAPTNYWVSQKYPPMMGLEATDCTKVAAFDAKGRPNVLHLMRELRPGQRRGLPYLAPVIATLKQISRLGEAELAASVVSSLFAVLIKKTGSNSFGPLGPPSKDSNGNTFSELQPGMIADLNPGEDITTVAPNRPNGAYDPFFRALVGQISLRIQIPPEVLFKKFDSSYTAARGALLQFWKFITCERELFLAPKLCQPVFEAWLEEDIAMGNTVAPGFFKDPMLRLAYCSAKWVGDSAPILDPLKEVLASVEAINGSLTTYSESTLRVNGGDFEANVERLSREERLRKEAGLVQAPVIKTPPSAKGIENNPVDPGQGDPNAEPNGAPNPPKAPKGARHDALIRLAEDSHENFEALRRDLAVISSRPIQIHMDTPAPAPAPSIHVDMPAITMPPVMVNVTGQKGAGRTIQLERDSEGRLSGARVVTTSKSELQEVQLERDSKGCLISAHIEEEN